MKKHTTKLIEKLSKLSHYTSLLHKYNSLQNKYDVLEEEMKNKSYEIVMKAITEQPTIDRLTEDNKRLRIKLKETRSERDEYIAELKNYKKRGRKNG